MRIVTNGSGLYAISKGWWIFTKYYDLETPGFWWTSSSRYYPSCWASKSKALKWYGILKPRKATRKDLENE